MGVGIVLAVVILWLLSLSFKDLKESAINSKGDLKGIINVTPSNFNTDLQKKLLELIESETENVVDTTDSEGESDVSPLATQNTTKEVHIKNLLEQLQCTHTTSQQEREDTYVCGSDNREEQKTVNYIGSWQSDYDNNNTIETITLYSENTGGSGTFYYAIAQENTGTFTQSLFLGDRIQFSSAEIVRGGLALNLSYIGHGEDDPFCCPTLKMQTEITYKNGNLNRSKPQEN